MSEPLSAFAQKNLDAKHEKILKALSREAANRRCVDCDNMGPQYVITTYGVFVCTACGGIHRQYGHRVKGISMSRFSKEEIAALQAGGNEKFFATYCSKWNPSDLTRPTDRNAERTKAWIESVYINKKYLGEAVVDAETAPTAAAAAASTGQAETAESAGVTTAEASGTAEDSASSGVTVLKLSDIGPVPKLQIGGPAGAASSSTPAASSVKSTSQPATPSAAAGGAGSAKTSPRPAVTAAPVAVSAPPAPVPSVMDAWDPFGETPTPPAAVAEVPVPKPASPVAPSAVVAATPATAAAASPAVAPPEQEASLGGWANFGEAFSAEPAPPQPTAAPSPQAALQELFNAVPVPAPAPPAAPAAPVAQTATMGWAASFDQPQQQQQPMPNGQPSGPPPVTVNGGNATPSPSTSRASTPSAASMHVQQDVAQGASPPKASFVPPQPARKEISLDAFYPEFETIRATGMLPTGQPVLQAQMTQWGVSPYAAQPQQPHRQPSPGYGHGHPLPSPGMQPPSPYSIPTPTAASPYYPQQQPAGTPAYPGAYPQPGMYPQASPMSAGYPQQTIHYMATPGHSPAAPSSTHGGGWPTPPPPQHYGQPTPTSGLARPPSGQALNGGKLGTDPFEHLAPQLKSALPSHSPKAASTPPFAGFPGVEPSRASPPPPPAASAVPVGTQTQAASATLFGVTTSMTAYDLSAPAAPKPKATGNPFA